ncbi:MAG: DUF177 domain-containing protein [Verrucomicrobiota bacterium]|nr:DUF177 domain-containing protein [Verrucomicrobiota bacterium]
MKVHLLQIPPEGVHLEGEEPSSILELHDDTVQSAGPIRYALDIGLSEGGLFATGTLGTKLRLQCVACLEHFIDPLHVDDFACQVELTGHETVDLTAHVREDILLALPPHPHCDRNGERICKGAFQEWTETAAEPLFEQPHVWGALDQLKLK